MELTGSPPYQAISERGDSLQKWLTAFLAAGLWLALINELRLEWSIDAEYSYGWVVPILCLYLFWERIKDAPPPERGSFSPALLCVFVGLCSFSFLPLRLLLEANPDWRLPDWGFASTVVGLTLSLILYAGGIPWLRHFCFPVAFFLVAVPWPVFFEQSVMQHLMQSNAWLSVRALVWCGFPALQRGNVIQISKGLVGIDEACSGVRSLQTTLMIGLFLGELYRFTLRRRAFLLGAALGFALLCNLGRTFFLVWISATRGIQEMLGWHDAAGLTVLVFCVAGLWQMARLFRKNGPRDARETSATPLGPATAESGAGRALATRMAGRLPPGKLLGALALWFIFSEAATELWYRSHEWNSTAKVRWDVQWPVMQPQFKDVEISENTKVILKYNEGRSAKWLDEDGSRWTMYFFRWFPGRASATLARGHRPEVCLPAAGLRMDKYLGIKEVKAGHVTLPFRSYLFDRQGVPLAVYYCLWEDQQDLLSVELPENRGAWAKVLAVLSGKRIALPTDPLPELAWTKVLAVLAGKRNLGEQLLEVTVSGFDTEEQAFAALQTKVAAMVKS